MSQNVENYATGGTKQWEVLGSAIAKIEAVQAASAITVGTSPFTYTNGGNGPVVVTVSGGTVSAIGLTRGATSSGSVGTAGAFLLHVGDELVTTFTAAPTMTLFPLLA